MLKFLCPCGEPLRADETLSGKKARCPKCGQVVVVPAFPAEASFDSGRQLFEQGRLHEAVTAFTETIRLAPKHANAFFYRAGVYRKMGRHDAVIADLTQAVRFQADFGEAYFRLALCHLLKNQYSDAVRNFTAAIRYDLPNLDLYTRRAAAYRAWGDIREAERDEKRIETIKRAAKLPPARLKKTMTEWQEEAADWWSDNLGSKDVLCDHDNEPLSPGEGYLEGSNLLCYTCALASILR